VPLVDLRIVDPDMGDVAHDGVATGEVVARPWLTQGYLHDPEASATLWAGGYLHTGDIGNIDEAGYLRVTDRIKDVIKTGANGSPRSRWKTSSRCTRRSARSR
jgi:fatty-acyl-CoA synthase